MLHHGTHHAFEQEDEPMIRAVRSRMHSNDQFAQRSALQSIDEAAVRGPQVLKRLVDAEAVGARQCSRNRARASSIVAGRRP